MSDPTPYKFGVITKIPEPGDRGNLATAIGSLFWKVKEDLDTPMIRLEELPQIGLGALNIHHEVFTVGEILVMIGGREISGHGRKPSKWSVTCEEFDTIEEAAKRAAEVRSW